MFVLKGTIKYLFFLLPLIGCVSLPASANVGLPMVMVIWPPLIILFIPIILIEYWVMKQVCRDVIPKPRLFWPIVLANLISTFIGIPLTWSALAGLEMGGIYVLAFYQVDVSHLSSYLWPFTAPWLYPGVAENPWIVLSSLCILLVVFYFISTWIEGLIVGWLNKPKQNRKVLHKGMRWANLYSYIFLCVMFAALYIFPNSWRMAIQESLRDATGFIIERIIFS